MDDSFDAELANIDINIPNTSSESNKVKVKPNNTAHCVLVNPKQRGNPLLKSICNVPYEYEEIIPDYQIGSTIGILFLSLRYHNLNPDYIHNRLKLLGKNFELRVLLVQVDLKDPHHALKTLTRICILADLTLMLAWSPEDAGKIVETYKIYEKKPADRIMEKSGEYPHQRLVQALTTIKPVNKTDALTLLNKFGTLKGIIKASEYQLTQCPGLGPRKAAKLHAGLHKNFCK
ncbi:DNA excision repair protein ERCC-1 [Chrysoperla carnea]|uniref:DNA excision repair protein ERCC-1 n=1 Tax=Chrysoperla carnea TaxID=189513 RepID=UPI001D06E43F|nr:DNA excision repair protein ERCC-1 [Chrysoperla carnea]